MHRATATHRVRMALLLLFAITLSACPRSSGGGSGGGTEHPLTTPDAGGVTYVKSYSIPGADFEVRDISVANDGTHYQVGVEIVPRAVADGPPVGALIVMHTDSAGDVLWARRFGDYDLDAIASVTDASESPDGGFWLAASTLRGPAVVKLAADGSVTATTDMGDVDPALVSLDAIEAMADGGYVVAGSQRQAAGRESQGFRLWLRGVDGSSRIRFTYTDDGDPTLYSDEVIGMLTEPGGELTLYGTRSHTDECCNAWITRFRQDGSLLFTQELDGSEQIGRAQGALAIPRTDRAAFTGLLIAGYRGTLAAEDGSFAERRRSEPRLAYLDYPVSVPTPNVRQDAVFPAPGPTRGANAFSALIADANDPNRVLAIGLRQRCTDPAAPRCSAVEDNYVTAFELGTDLQFAPGANTGLSALGLADDDLVLAAANASNGQRLFAVAAGLDRSQTPVIVSTDAGGAVQWRHRASTLATVSANGLVPTRDGGVLARDARSLQRLGPDGAPRWNRSFGSARRLLETPTVHALGAGGAVVLANSEDGVGEVGIVLRYSATGELLFAQELPFRLHGVAGLDVDHDGQEDDGLLLVASRAENVVLIDLDGRGTVTRTRAAGTTSTRGDVHLSQAGSHIALRLGSRTVLWLDGAGEPQDTWQFAANTTDVAANADGSAWVLVDCMRNGDACTGTTLTRIDRDGAPLFSRRVDPRVAQAGQPALAYPPEEDFAITALGSTSDGGVTITGQVQGVNKPTCGEERRCTDGFIARLTPTGALQWQRAYGAAGSEAFGTAARELPDHGVLVAGASTSFDARPLSSTLSVRADANGSVSSACQAEQASPVAIALTDSALLAAPARAPASLGTLATAAQRAATSGSTPVTIVTGRSCGGASTAPALQVVVHGEGSVHSTPDGIDCGTDCEQAYADGTQVQLFASPGTAAGARFDGWSSGCANFGTQPRITLTLRASLTCTATFSAPSAPAAPVARFTFANLTHPGSLPIAGQDTVRFDATGSTADGAIARYEWDFDGDRTVDVVTDTGAPAHGTAQYVFPAAGSFEAVLRITDTRGQTAIAREALTITTPPTSVSFTLEALFQQTGNFPNRIQSTPAGMDCTAASADDACFGEFSVPEVRLRVTVAPGNHFTGWVDCDAVVPAAVAGGPSECVVRASPRTRFVFARFQGD